ncbi:uncharacterized protein LOC134816642 [Bolinopsis microptera]|uniref:uncharacterized protein LOC134816642 n=1 Tax=Bolinopsis microptera TaxID=2820187 RepID=UPI0030792397
MTIITLLVVHSSWEGAATDLTSQLWNEGVKKGSILWIDAHCQGGVISSCHLTAYYDDRFETTEEQTYIKYKLINDSFSWETFYNQADQFVSMLEPRDVISITASCSMSYKINYIPIVSNAVLFVFYYDNIYYHNNFQLTVWGDPNTAIPTAAISFESIPLPALMMPAREMLELTLNANLNARKHREKQIIKHCEVRDHSWSDAAAKIISELEDKGAKAGQIIAIDAHNNDQDGWAIFSAWWNESLPEFGDLKGYMMKEGINNRDSWKEQAIKARDSIAEKSDGKEMIKVFSFTSSINELMLGVTYTFYAKDKVVSFILDEEKLITEEPVRRFKKTPTTQSNTADVNVEHWETLRESSENTSTFKTSYVQTSGWTLTAGAEIPVPETPATISATVQKTQTERWEKTTEIVNKEGTSFEIKVEFIIPPKSILVVRFIEEIREFSAPYTMTMESGRVCSGIWKATNTTVHTREKSFPMDTPGDEIERELKNTDIY